MNGGTGADRYNIRAAGSEISGSAKADGDQVATAAGMVLVKTAGVFGILALGDKPFNRSSEYYIVESKEGEKDLLA